jgi:hypothetical protein
MASEWREFHVGSARPAVLRVMVNKLYYFAAAIEGIGPKEFKLIANVCKSWNVILDTYLLATYKYYQKDDPILSDFSYDALVQYIAYHHMAVRKLAVNGAVLPVPFGPSSSHAIIVPSDIIEFSRVYE